MRYDKLEAADEVVKRLFDPRYSYKKAYIPLELKYAYGKGPCYVQHLRA